MSDHILTTLDNHLLTIQMNRPEKKNALTREMYAAMAAALHAAEADDDIRVVLFTGTGGCFTSGNDLMDFINLPAPDEPRPVEDFLRTISTYKKPLVAAVNGLAIGVGVTMLMHCDFVYAAENARFRLPFVNLGVVPEAGSSLLLSHLVGARKAAELLMLGDWFDASKAVDLNFVNTLVANEQLLTYTLAQIDKLLAMPPEALRLTKELLKRPLADALQETIDIELRYFADRLQSAEAQAVFMKMMQR